MALFINSKSRSAFSLFLKVLLRYTLPCVSLRRMVYRGSGLKFLISFSLSMTRDNTAVCTLPTEMPRIPSALDAIGEKTYPRNRSVHRRAFHASTKFSSMERKLCNAFCIASGVIDVKVILYISWGRIDGVCCNNRFFTFHAIASPSLSGSEAKITFAPLHAFRNLETTLCLFGNTGIPSGNTT